MSRALGRRGARALIACALAVLVAAGCDEDNPYAPQVIEELTFDPSLGIDLSQFTKLPEGVYILDQGAGMGDPVQEGDTVVVELTGWFANGSSFGSGQTSPTLYPQGFIPGFSLGLQGMAVGATRRMIIPPELGYGEFGSGPIPPGTVLIFDAELLSIS